MVDIRPKGDDFSSCVYSKKKSMKIRDLKGYFGVLRDSDILDNMKAKILRMREL